MSKPSHKPFRRAQGPEPVEGLRPGTFEAWASARTVPGARLAAFERWLWGEMSTRLVWPKDRAAQARQIGQCRSFVVQAVGDLGEHGFLFQPRELAKVIEEKLDAIAEMQRAGNVENLWPYFRACWHRWVRCETEDLRDRAMSVGAHISQISERMLRGAPVQPASVPEIVAQSLREQAAAARRKNRGMDPAAAGQEDLFNRVSSCSKNSSASAVLQLPTSPVQLR